MKTLPMQLLLKVMSPKIMAKAIASFDRATTIVVGTCWAGALLMVGFALYTLTMAAHAKQMLETALVAEPTLPRILHTNAEARDVQSIVDRLQHLYPEISFSFRNNLAVSGPDGKNFRQWLSAIDYADTISPQYHWTIQELCVGKCSSRDLMHAYLVGDKISFEKPQTKSKD